METNLEKAKRLVYDHAYTGGIELPKDGFLFKMLELAATPDPSNPINNDLHIPAVSVSVAGCPYRVQADCNFKGRVCLDETCSIRAKPATEC